MFYNLIQDIKEFMDSGKNAVIYFSLGSVVPTHLMPEHYIKAFVSTFSKLPYKVILCVITFVRYKVNLLLA